MQHADKEDESCAQRGIRGGGYYCAPSSSIQFKTLEPELLNGKQMEIYCPRADAATTNSTASLLASFFLPDPIFFLLSVTLSLHHHVLHGLLQTLGARCEL